MVEGHFGYVISIFRGGVVLLAPTSFHEPKTLNPKTLNPKQLNLLLKCVLLFLLKHHEAKPLAKIRKPYIPTSPVIYILGSCP